MYLIDGLHPRTDIPIGRFCLHVHLHPMMKELSKKCGLTQEMVNTKVEKLGPSWLTSCGFDSKLYEPARCAIRIAWGEWGIEHITVPGNACGLDISDGAFGCVFRNGRTLSPHNLDSWGQQNLLLMVFTSFMADIAYRLCDQDVSYFGKSAQHSVET